MQYVCRYGTPDGRVLTQLQEGSDEAAVRRDLERQGLHIFEVRPRGFALPMSWPSGLRRRRKLSGSDFLIFNLELAALLRAGLPLLQSLDLMLERVEQVGFRTVLAEIRDRVQSGEELSEAFASFGDLFPPLYSSTLKAGERTGELEKVLERFIRYLRLVLEARKKIVSAIVYPAVLIVLSLLMLVVMAVYVLPNFRTFYDQLNIELPVITRVTMAVATFVRDQMLWLVLASLAAVALFRRWVRTSTGRRTVDRWRLGLPFVGQIFHRFALSEFCRSLSTLLAGGLPLLTALETAVEAVSNAHIREALRPTLDDIREGKTFYESLEATGIFPKLSIDMVKVGEATGSLDEMLSSVSDHFDERVETRMQRLLSLLEPAMLVVMGMLIALLLVSIYLPMFSALGQIGN